MTMNFIEYLKQIEAHLGMYLPESNITHLEIMFHGYESALKRHNIKNDFGCFNQRFGIFLYNKYNWSTSRGWAFAIKEHVEREEDYLDEVFALFREFFITENIEF